jgi:hypothetical protein
MAGGKGGSTTSSVTIPEYIEEAARRNLAKAEGISQIGYVPYYGPRCCRVYAVPAGWLPADR